MECHLVHAIPGRIRLRITDPALGDGLAPGFSSFLAARPGVRSVRVNPTARSVVVTYAAEVASGEDLFSLVRAVSAEELRVQPDESTPESAESGRASAVMLALSSAALVVGMVVRGALITTNGATRILAGASEQITDLVAKVRAKSWAAGDGSGAGKQRAAVRHA